MAISSSAHLCSSTVNVHNREGTGFGTDGPGVPTLALPTGLGKLLRRINSKHPALGAVGKLQCDTMNYIAGRTVEPTDTASLLLLNYLFASKGNLSLSSQLLPGPQLFQEKCFFIGTLNFTIGVPTHLP